MPGLSSRQPVSGMDGIGKIHIKFKPKPKKKFPFGALLFLSTCFAYLLVYLNSKPSARHYIVLPFLRFLYLGYGQIQQYSLKNDMKVYSLTGKVNISKDMNGISFVEAENLPDALFGQGYLHASMHSFSLEMRRRTASGRLAEIEGYYSLPSDRLARAIDFSGLAKRDLELESEENVALLNSYVNGINTYINATRLPSLSLLLAGIVSVEMWKPQDVLMLMRLDAFLSEGSVQKSLMRNTIATSLGDQASAEFMEALEGHAVPSSDGHFVEVKVDGIRSLKSDLETVWAVVDQESKHPILAASLTVMDGSFNTWHTVDIAGGSDFHVLGASRPGIPFVQHGRSDKMSWTTLSSSSSSAVSLHDEVVRSGSSEYLVERNAIDEKLVVNCVSDIIQGEVTRNEVCTDSGNESMCTSEEVKQSTLDKDLGSMKMWCPLEERVVDITVRQDDNKTVDTILNTYRGPVVSHILFSGDRRFAKKVLTLAGPSLTDTLSIEFLKSINSAKNSKEALLGVKHGSKAFGQLIFSTENEVGRGIIGGANSFDSEIFNSGTVIGGRSAQVIQRVEDLLNTTPEGTSKDVQFYGRVQCDSVSAGASWFVRLVLDVLDHHSFECKSDCDQKALAVDILRPVSELGNVDMSPGSIFLEILILTVKRSILSPLQRDPDVYRHLFANRQYSTLKGSPAYTQLLVADSAWLFRLLEFGKHNSSWWVRDAGGLEQLILRAVVAAVDTAEKYYGPSSSWSWSKSHVSFISRSVRFPFSPAGVDFEKALAVGPYSAPGSTDTVFQNGYEGNMEESSRLNHPLSSKMCLRSMFRMVVDMGNLPESWIQPGPGISSEIESKSYASLFKDWSDCTLPSIPWDTKAPVDSSRVHFGPIDS